MKLSEHGHNLIKHFEGLRLQACQCSAGVWTVGYGHTAGAHSGDVIDGAQAEAFLRKDVVGSENAVNRLVKVSLKHNQFDALVSFVFNLDCGNFRTTGKTQCRRL